MRGARTVFHFGEESFEEGRDPFVPGFCGHKQAELSSGRKHSTRSADVLLYLRERHEFGKIDNDAMEVSVDVGKLTTAALACP